MHPSSPLTLPLTLPLYKFWFCSQTRSKRSLRPQPGADGRRENEPLQTAATPFCVPPPQGYPPEGYTKHFYPPPSYQTQDKPVAAPPQQQSSSTGFLKSCLASLCCCCLLDACF